MSDSPLTFSLGPCPICQQGQCRVRWCQGPQTALPIVLCDECEAFWNSPDVSQPHSFLDAESGRVGESDWWAWGADGRWATTDEITLLGWDRPSGPITTEWVLPSLDLTSSIDISFIQGTTSITMMGQNFETDPQVPSPPEVDLPPKKPTDE
jgi:hypothetical protein